MKIAIAGAGIGGLTAAIALAQRSHDVTVIEKAPTAKPVGAGINLQPNAITCLALLGLEGKLNAVGYSAGEGNLYFSNGRLFHSVCFDDLKRPTLARCHAY